MHIFFLAEFGIEAHSEPGFRFLDFILVLIVVIVNSALEYL